jgi:Ran GTPase-activating protein 1
MLQTLSFSNEANKRWDTIDDGKRVAAKILQVNRIHTLELSGNTLGIEASGPIAEALKKHPELKIAQWKDIFTTRLNTEIPVVLKSFTDALIFAGTRLTTLDLSDNAIGPQAIHGLEDFLSGEACFGLKNLYLNNCGLGGAGTTVAKCLIECHKKALKSGKFFELEVFVAGRNRLENAGAKALADAFSTLKSLVEIRMYQYGIKEAGIMELAKAFSKNPKLKIIDLNDNTFNESAATAMSKVVGKLNDLIILDFTDCLCRSKGSLNIVHELINGNSGVQELLLGGNEIDAISMKKITQMSQQLPSLKKFVLSANNLGHEYEEIKQSSNNGVFDFGTESDDQGSLSGSDD